MALIVEIRTELIDAIKAVVAPNITVKAGRGEESMSDPGPVATIRVQWWGGTSSKNAVLGSGRAYVYRPEYRVFISTRESNDTLAAELVETVRGALLGSTVQLRFKLEPDPGLEAGRTEDYLGSGDGVCVYAQSWAVELLQQ